MFEFHDLDVLIVTDKGMSATELTSRSVSRTPEGDRPDVLPALAFCLLFRFQGAVALAHLGGDGLPAWLGALCSSGAFGLRGAK
jgi:hypothetical protein